MLKHDEDIYIETANFILIRHSRRFTKYGGAVNAVKGKSPCRP